MKNSTFLSLHVFLLSTLYIHLDEPSPHAKPTLATVFTTAAPVAIAPHDTVPCNAMLSSSSTMTSNTSSPVVSASTLHSRLLNGGSTKETPAERASYLSRLPIEPFRLAIILLLVISALTISALNNDLDGQLTVRQKIAEKLGCKFFRSHFLNWNEASSSSSPRMARGRTLNKCFIC